MAGFFIEDTMKSLVETTGQFQLIDPNNGFLVAFDRPSVPPENSAFIQSQFGLGQLRLISHVSDDATDAEFQTYWDEAEGNQALAVESFVSAFALPSELGGENPKPEKKKKADK